MGAPPLRAQLSISSSPFARTILSRVMCQKFQANFSRRKLGKVEIEAEVLAKQVGDLESAVVVPCVLKVYEADSI